MTDWIRKIEESDGGKAATEKVKLLVKGVEDVKEKFRLPSLPCEWKGREEK